MTETWKDIFGYEGYYQVSNTGRVKSLTRIEVCGGRAKQRIRRERILKPSQDKDGYLKVVLCKDRKLSSATIHRLVLLTFKPGGFSIMRRSVNHIDGKKQNNALDNLEWCSIAENHRHAIQMGMTPIGEKHYKAKLTYQQVTQIKDQLPIKSHTEIAQSFGVNLSTIQDIYKGRSWKSHVLV